MKPPLKILLAIIPDENKMGLKGWQIVEEGVLGDRSLSSKRTGFYLDRVTALSVAEIRRQRMIAEGFTVLWRDPPYNHVN